MTRLLIVLIGLALFSTVSMGCKAQGSVDTHDMSQIGR
jgi:hypothetical protein